ncbi:cysteine--tRNA ligase [Pacificimonas sp. WHA3]|uniref:Cysteine--tRNA ligase n=1 Tax=Pacificimonas pallii TaxID=2827236 RepID=A0ABS6SB38_9SPHN|nr:cysteine--tRNA ligase [Pacificimonas pallii]MBV7255531.1 cysteine--tRNA ligase [Pacificimonas pallii]
MTRISVYDTAMKEKRVFTPADPRRITIYVCGPTVYSRAHIGNFRPEVTFDVLRRLLTHVYGKGVVVSARNYTDIDDKIMARADAEGRTIEQVTAQSEGWYEADARALGCALPTFAPRATETIAEMIAMMETLIAGGHAYAAEGHVLFDVAADTDYGAISHRDLEQMIAGSRVEVAPYKKNAHDFVMWKPSADHQPGWASPWGRGRPGWHLECSAMIAKHLGETIDIHGGGQDLIFPHHENEAAQSRCAHKGAPLARYWMHNGFLSFGKDKMSKSEGNIVTVDALLAAGHRGETVRMAMLTAHYRQPLEWNDDLLKQAKSTLDRWYRVIEGAAGDVDGDAVDEGVVDAIANDLGTPAAMARLSELASAGDIAGLRASAGLLGLLQDDPAAWRAGEGDRGDIDARVAQRNAAKAAKDWAAADRIRDELAAEGIILEDGPQGTIWRRA